MNTLPQNTSLTVSTLWRGAILSTIVHAVWIAHHPSLTHEVSWDGLNYNRQDSMGTRGTVSFANGDIVAAFSDIHSERYPSKLETDRNFEPSVFFQAAPATILLSAKQNTFPYLLDNIHGEVIPAITAAFWNSGESLVSSEDWETTFQHGAHIIKSELLETNVALNLIEHDYEMNSEQLQLIHSLLLRRLSHDGALSLSDDEKLVFFDSKAQDLNNSLALLKAVNIHW